MGFYNEVRSVSNVWNIQNVRNIQSAWTIRKLRKLRCMGPCLSFIALLLFSQSVYAVTPLLNSSWAEKNPGLLPVSECRITASLKFDEAKPLLGGAFGVGVGGAFLNSKYLLCASKKTNLAYAIPITRLKMISFPALSCPAVRMSDVRIDAESLNQKSVGDLLATFRGGEFMLNPGLAGAGLSSFRNSRGIRMSIETVSVGLGVDLSLGYSSFAFKTRPLEKGSAQYMNPLILTTTTFRGRTGTSKPISLRLKDSQEKILRKLDGSVIAERSDGAIVWEIPFLTQPIRDANENVQPEQLSKLRFIHDSQILDSQLDGE